MRKRALESLCYGLEAAWRGAGTHRRQCWGCTQCRRCVCEVAPVPAEGLGTGSVCAGRDPSLCMSLLSGVPFPQVQFVLTIIQTTCGVIWPCSFPMGWLYFQIGYMISLIILFTNFYNEVSPPRGFLAQGFPGDALVPPRTGGREGPVCSAPWQRHQGSHWNGESAAGQTSCCFPSACATRGRGFFPPNLWRFPQISAPLSSDGKLPFRLFP